MIWGIYNHIKDDDLIRELVADRIKFYEYPGTGEVSESGAHVIIDPLGVPLQGDFADDTWLTDDFLFQVDVWSQSMDITELVSSRIQELLWQIHLGQNGGMDEYDADVNIFRQARRYEGKKYRGSV